MRYGLALAATLLASPLQAQEASEAVESAVASRYAEAVVDGCLPMARGDVDFSNTSPTEDSEIIAAQGFDYGIDGDVLARFGVQGSGVLNNAIMGKRAAGEDMFVLAIGGALPGCKVILLRPESANLEDEVATAFSTLQPEWRELPFARTRPGTNVTMRRFIMRDEDNTPFLINLITTPIPDSQIRLVATLSPIPANVQIPEGY